MSFHLHACTKPLFTLSNSFVEDILWYASPCVNEALLQVAGVASFPSQPNCASQDISGFPTHCFAPHSKSVIVCVCSSNGSWCQNESGVAWCRISDRKFSCVVASRKSLMFFFKSLFVILAALSNLCSQKRYEAVKFSKKNFLHGRFLILHLYSLFLRTAMIWLLRKNLYEQFPISAI